MIDALKMVYDELTKLTCSDSKDAVEAGLLLVYIERAAAMLLSEDEYVDFSVGL